MSSPHRLRSLYQWLIALCAIAVVVIPLAILSRTQSKQQAAVASKQAAIDAVRKRGATVVLGPTGNSDLPPDVVSVDLSKAVVDAELIQTLAQFTGIERLSLDGAKLQPQDWALLGKLPRLQRLSLSRSNVSDADLVQLSPALKTLVLTSTSITDESMSRLAALNGLTNLDIADTEVTPEGLRQIVKLRSLKNLSIDDSCINADSVESLRLMQLESVDVAVSEGVGQKTHELLSVCKGPKIKGLHRDGHVLWDADSAWSNTLAGVFEAVVAEIGLDSQQAAQLLKAIGAQGNWAVTVLDPDPALTAFLIHRNSQPDRGIEIASVEELVRGPEKHRVGSEKSGVYVPYWDDWGVRRFVRDKFTASNVPQFLAACHAAQVSPGEFPFGPFLLVHYGIDNPEARAELDRLLAHGTHQGRVTTFFAFGYAGASRFYSREEWVPNKAADAFAAPRLLRICKDKGEIEEIRVDATKVLVEIAHRRPEYGSEVIQMLVELLIEESSRHASTPHPISRVDIPRLAEVNSDAAIAEVPKLRAMLENLDEQLAGAPAANRGDTDSPRQAVGAGKERMLQQQRISVLHALSATAHHDPALAHEIALEYLARLESGQPVGPFATLLSPDTPEANRMVVMALLRDANANSTKGELASIAKKIRDWRTIKEQTDK